MLIIIIGIKNERIIQIESLKRMEKFSIEVEQDNEKLHFQIVDYVHDDTNKCQFEIFHESTFVASFQPDKHGFLHICKNPGGVKEQILHLLADKIERLNI